MDSRRILTVTTIMVLHFTRAQDFMTGDVKSPHFTADPRDLVLVTDPSGRATGTLSCEAGPPGVGIRWTRNGQPLAGAHSGTLTVGWASGKQFPIGTGANRNRFGGDVNNVGEQDVGAAEIYRCVAYNSVGSVKSRPARVSKADIRLSALTHDDVVNIYALEGASVFIPCSEFTSNPPAQLSVENLLQAPSSRVSSDRTRMIQSLNGLLITDVRLSDSGEYRCSATNPLSKQRLYDTRLVWLNVTTDSRGARPLKFVQMSPDQLYVTEGESLTLMCLAEGHPRLAVTWKRYGGQLPQGHQEVTPGVLHIQNTQKLDEGTYICEASTDLNEMIRHIIFVSVKEPPAVIVPPADLEVPLGGPATLSCKVYGSPKPLISWLHNTQPISHRKPYSLSDSGSTLTIESVSAEHGGMYQCVARSSVGVAQAAARLTVLKSLNQSQPRPVVEEAMLNNAPYDEAARRRTRLSAEEYLKSRQTDKPNYFNSESDYILASKEQERDRPVERRRNPKSRRPQGTSALNSGLESEQFVASNKGPVPKPGGKEAKQQSRVELVQPPKLRVSLLTDDSVMIEWKRRRRLNGLRVLFVKLQYKNMDERRHKGWRTVDEDISPAAESYTLTGLKPGDVYQFRLVHVYSNHDNKQGPKTKLRMSLSGKRERVAPPAPVIVKVLPLSNSSMAISWQYMQEGRVTIDGFFVYYQRYQHGQEMFAALGSENVCGRSSDDLQVIASNENLRDLVLHGLDPDTEYSICMQCFTGRERSQFSNTVVKRTLPGSKSEHETSTSHDSIVPGEGGYSTHRPGVVTYEAPTDLASIFMTGEGWQTDETLYMALGIILGIMVVLLVIGGLGCYCSQKYQPGHNVSHHYSNCRKAQTGQSFSSDMNILATQRFNKEELKWLPSPQIGSGINRFIDQISNTDEIQGFTNTGTERSSLSSSMASHNSVQQFTHGRSHCRENDIYDRKLYTYDGDFGRDEPQQHSSLSTNSISDVSGTSSEEEDVVSAAVEADSSRVGANFHTFRGSSPPRLSHTIRESPPVSITSHTASLSARGPSIPDRGGGQSRGSSSVADGQLREDCRGFSESSLEDFLRDHGSSHSTDHSDDSADDSTAASSLTRCLAEPVKYAPQNLSHSRIETSSPEKSDLSLSDEDFLPTQSAAAHQYTCSTL